jgi:hypothetical protein
MAEWKDFPLDAQLAIVKVDGMADAMDGRTDELMAK